MSGVARRAQVGIIGGTGLGELLAREGGQAVDVHTPFGPPSSRPILARWEGADVAFIARHGDGHRFDPAHVPYRANIMALKMLGVSSILASGAVGSLREDIEPGQLVICDQVIDRTCRRASTFFEEGIVAHVELADPFCPALRRALIEAASGLDSQVHHAGAYLCMEGPQFSTRAESHMHRAWGADVVGMTAMPEAKLAREAELCYALVALATDYDCWRPHSARLGETDLLHEIRQNLQRATERANALIRKAVQTLDWVERACTCHDALGHAIWSDLSGLQPRIREQLRPIIGRYLR